MESWYFLIRAVGLLNSKCHQHFPSAQQLASPQIKLKVAFISSLQLWTHCPGLWSTDGNHSLCPCEGSGCARVRVCECVCVSVSVYGWLNSSGTHPRELWAVNFYFSKFRIGNQKGGRKLLHLMLLWLYVLLVKLFRNQNQAAVVPWNIV